MKQTYIFICSYNRLQPLQKLVDSLLSRNYTNIVILDNQSTYQPLLDWYETIKNNITIHYCNENYGPGALDMCRFNEENFSIKYGKILNEEYHVYTDSDVVPVEEAPYDFIDNMIKLCKKYNIPKLGLSLKIDDLPDHFVLKEQVVAHESSFFKREYIDDLVCRLYKAPVDTTFAVNAPGLLCGYNENAYRTGNEYFAMHYPWYYDTKNLPEDERYYYGHITKISHWSNLIKKNIEI